jgi:FMN phosphatase YigB (HAD superfamily)
MTLSAVFFDVGDTLVEGWAPREDLGKLLVAALTREFGERPWYADWVRADIEPYDRAEPLRQQTNLWYERWFAAQAVVLDGITIDQLRAAMCIPLSEVARLVPGAGEALRWCKARGLRVVLVSNTLSRGDAEVLRDWRGFGLADAIDSVVSSPDVGWRKPHRAIFDRALQLAGVTADQAVMIGDRLDADVRGAKDLGMRAIWRRPTGGPPQAETNVVPDAVVEDLTRVPAVLGGWLARISSAP